MDFSISTSNRLWLSFISFLICLVTFFLINYIFITMGSADWMIIPAFSASAATALVTYWVNTDE